MIEKDCVNKKLSSNINEVIRAVLSPLFCIFFFFFGQKHFSHTKSTKRSKSTKTQPSKSTKRKYGNKNLKCASKTSEWKKKLIPLFAFLCFLCTRRKENRKKKEEKSLQCNVLNTSVPINHFRCVPAQTGLCGHKLSLHFNLIKIS